LTDPDSSISDGQLYALTGRSQLVGLRRAESVIAGRMFDCVVSEFTYPYVDRNERPVAYATLEASEDQV
jgi:hypothetical protein